MSRRSFVLPAAPIVIAALLVTGCGGDSVGTTPGPELTEAANPPTTTTPAPTTTSPPSTTTTPATSETTPTTSTPAPATNTTTTPSAATAAAGKKIFTSQGCGACHTLSEAGASGTVGPDLDQVLKGQSTAFITESIVKPNAEIAKGYSAGIMPQDFGQKLSKQEISQLVDFLAKSTGG
jgi:mono/diheme cytochrome c family protein